jgi:4-amino-4-deoxy-L-arabinose transferase-like glycosyltransferase
MTMDFVEYTNSWVKDELSQAKIMIGIGLILLFVFYSIFKVNNELLKGTLIPLGLLLAVLVGYGSYILTSRPAHAKQSIELYHTDKHNAITQEKAKHINDNKAGKTLIKYIYPGLILVSLIVLILSTSLYYKGLAIGCIFLFASTYIIDNGFVTRSDNFIEFLEDYSITKN